jgi:hypothetical protein
MDVLPRRDFCTPQLAAMNEESNSGMTIKSKKWNNTTLATGSLCVTQR